MKILSNTCTIILVIVCTGLFAQHKCATKIMSDERIVKEVSYKEGAFVLEQLRKGTNNLRTEDVVLTTVTIPVVVHVLYKTAVQNISDAQIKSQIDILNRDFAGLNADSLPPIHTFYSSVGKSNISFCLAAETPNGIATTGIERKNVSVDGYSSNNSADEDKIKKSSLGGLSAWNTAKYLNIWIVNLTDNTLGYATLPSTSVDALDGVVIKYSNFGNIGTVTSPYNKGRTTTHEVGHWLGLQHIWGDEAGCSTDDGIDDTPVQDEEVYDCPCGILPDACSPRIMYMNYMDYTEDACMSMFTKGQMNYMNSVLNNNSLNRKSFVTNNGSIDCVSYTPSADNSTFPCDITSTAVNYKNYEVAVYPNPATTSFRISNLPITSDNQVSIQVINQLGALVLQQQFNSNSIDVDISLLSRGIYTVVVSNSKYRFTKNLVVVD